MGRETTGSGSAGTATSPAPSGQRSKTRRSSQRPAHRGSTRSNSGSPVNGLPTHPSDQLTEKVRIEGYDITVHPPTASYPYHRIVYTGLRGGRQFVSAGRTWGEVEVKLAALMVQFDEQAHHSGVSVTAMLDAYLNPARPRAKQWSRKHTKTVSVCLDRFVRPTLGDVTCGELAPELIQRAVNSAPSAGEGHRVKRILSAALRWAETEGYLTLSPDRLLRNVFWTAPQGGPLIGPVHGTGVRPIVQGADALWVDPDSEIPPADQVGELAYQLTRLSRAKPWWALLAMVAAYSGLRLGELFALTVDKVNLDRQSIRVDTQVVEVDSELTLELPKGGKVRATVFPAVTPPCPQYPNGFPLADLLAARVAEVRADNPQGLLFPAPRGGLWRSTNFYRNRFHPAAKAARWPTHQVRRRSQKPADKGAIVVADKLDWTWHSLRHVFCHYYLWDVGATPVDVSNAAGHANVEVTLRIYASNASGSVERLAALSAAATPTTGTVASVSAP